MTLLEPHSPELRMRWVGLMAAMGVLIDCMQGRGGHLHAHDGPSFPVQQRRRSNWKSSRTNQPPPLACMHACYACPALPLPCPRTLMRLCAQSAGALQVAGAQGLPSSEKGGKPKWPCNLFGSVV